MSGNFLHREDAPMLSFPLHIRYILLLLTKTNQPHYVCVVPRVNKGAKACTQYVMVLQRGCKVNHAAITQVCIMVEMVIYWFITSFIANISNILQFMLCKSWHVKTNKLCVGLTGLFYQFKIRKLSGNFFLVTYSYYEGKLQDNFEEHIWRS